MSECVCVCVRVHNKSESLPTTTLHKSLDWTLNPTRKNPKTLNLHSVRVLIQLRILDPALGGSELYGQF